MSIRAVVLGVVLSAAACGGGPTAPTAADLAGTWQGPTQQGRTISLQVTSAGITSLTVGFSVPGSFCTASGSSTTTFSNPLTITNGSFSYSGSGSTAISVNGTFSRTSASGSATVTSQTCGASTTFTWSATKN